jgi:hypothetical protein
MGERRGANLGGEISARAIDSKAPAVRASNRF